jgi:hypothetical protein
VSLRFGNDGTVTTPSPADPEVVVALDDDDIAAVIHALVLARAVIRSDRAMAREWDGKVVAALEKFTLIRKSKEDTDAEPTEASA